MRKPLNLKDLGKNPASVTLPKTPFERGMGADVSRPFPAQPPKVQDGPKREFPMNASQAPTIGGYDAKNEPPKINAKPWQIAAQNWRAKQAKEIGVGDITRDRNATVAETASQFMIERDALTKQLDPQTARIDAAQQALEALFAQRPELAEQAKLSMPNEAQLGVAGLAAILQPNRAFESLATPFRFQQEEQARQQQLNNQQFASDQQEWGLMWQRATGDLNNEISMETNRQKNVLGAIESLDQLTSDIYSQDAQTQRTAMTVQGREQVAGMNNETQIAKTLIQVQGMMSREEFKSPEAVASRIYQSEVAKGTPPELATEIAQAAIRSDFYKNEQARAVTLERLTLLPIKVQQGVANIAKTQADIDYIAARSEYVRSQAEALGDDYALNLMKYGLEVDKFNRSKETGDAQATLKGAEALLGAQQARAKVLGDQLKAAEQAFTLAENTPREAEAKALVDRLRGELATTNNDILSAVRAMETLTGTRPQFSLGGLVQQGVQNIVGGAANSGGGFRAEPQWPVAGGRISSNFGLRRAPTRGASTNHNGIDIAVPGGTPIKPVWAGEVVRKGYQANGGGHFIVIRHPNGYETKYLHMQAASPLAVGAKVGNSTVIGKVGSTGISTGNHLDVRFYKDGRYHDPLKILPRR